MLSPETLTLYRTLIYWNPNFPPQLPFKVESCSKDFHVITDTTGFNGVMLHGNFSGGKGFTTARIAKVICELLTEKYKQERK